MIDDKQDFRNQSYKRCKFLECDFPIFFLTNDGKIAFEFSEENFSNYQFHVHHGRFSKLLFSAKCSLVYFIIYAIRGH